MSQTSLPLGASLGGPSPGGLLSCQELVELVSDYLEGKLDFWERVRFEVHVGLCISCRRYLRQMRQTIRALGSVQNLEIPQEVELELLQRFRNWPRDPRGP